MWIIFLDAVVGEGGGFQFSVGNFLIFLVLPGWLAGWLANPTFGHSVSFPIHPLSPFESQVTWWTNLGRKRRHRHLKPARSLMCNRSSLQVIVMTPAWSGIMLYSQMTLLSYDGDIRPPSPCLMNQQQPKVLKRMSKDDHQSITMSVEDSTNVTYGNCLWLCSDLPTTCFISASQCTRAFANLSYPHSFDTATHPVVTVCGHLFW